MIGMITGTVAASTPTSLLIQTPGGVGYLVATTIDTATAHSVGTKVQLLTHLVVREDQLALYGFATEPELRFFNQLITVSGVGPKMALAILGAGTVSQLQTAIANNEVAILTTISGVGRKTAERIMVELKNQVQSTADGADPAGTEELLAALTQLGYNAYEVRRIALEIPSTLSSTEERIKFALKLLAK